ncbi:MAG: glycosyltransferase family 39 protein [Ruminococcus sp.]|nr:glycosyltransferase family 39 protein [Ruminococcus sp.]
MSKKTNKKTTTTATAPATIADAQKQSKFEYVVVNIICLFAFLAFGYIAIMGFFQTSRIDPVAYSAEKILFETDNLALNLFFTAIFILILFAMRRFYDFFAKINMIALEIILTVYVILIGFIWIFSVTSIPAADSANIYETARQAAVNDYTSLHDFTNFYNKDFYSGYSYYNFYPFQLGFVLICEVIYRIFGTESSMPVQVINVLATGAAYLGLAKITRLLFKRKSIEFMAVFLLALCFQPIIFCTFVYGNILGMSLGIWACFFLIKYFQTNKWTFLIPCGILLVVSTIAKYNNLIYLIAFVIMLIVHVVKEKKWQSIAFAVAICIATVGSSSLIIASYESRAGVTLANGVSQVLYLDMGMQESGRAPGWYTTTGLSIYLKNQFDDDAANAEAWQQIDQRMNEFSNRPEYALDFYSKKILSQWNEPTFESIWVSKVKGHEIDVKGGIGEAVYDKSLGQFLELHFGLYMRVLYLLFAIGIYALFIRKKTNICTVLLPLVLMGGFGYHFLCEAKSQYILTYVPLIIPTAAYALNLVLLGDYSKLKKAVAKINEIPKAFKPIKIGKKNKK